MKKIFTLLTAALMSGFAAQAVETTISYTDYDEVVNMTEEQTCEYAFVGDVCYVSNFMYSGATIGIELPALDAVGWSSKLDFTMGLYTPQGYKYPYLYDEAKNDYAMPTLPNFEEEGEDVAQDYVIVYPTYSAYYDYGDGWYWVSICMWCSESSDYVYAGFEVERPATLDFADVLAGSMPSNEEAINLHEYALGAGYINVVLGGELSLNSFCSAPVELWYNGEKVAEVTLSEDNVVPMGGAEPFVEGDDDDIDPGMSVDPDDEVDPGMSENGTTIVELDFDSVAEVDLAKIGEYTVKFPAALLVYNDGTQVGAGEITYTIDTAILDVEIEPAAGEDLYELSYFSVYFPGFASLKENEEAEEPVYIAGKNGERIFGLERIPMSVRLSETAATAFLETPVGMSIVTPGSYKLVIPAGYFIAVDAEGNETPAAEIVEYYIVEQAPAIDINELIISMIPENEIDVTVSEDETGDNMGFVKGLEDVTYMLYGNVTVVANMEAEEVPQVELKKDGNVLRSSGDYICEPYIPEVADDEDDTFAPVEALSVAQILFDAEEQILGAGEYEVVIPEGIFALGNAPVYGTVTYTIIDNTVGIESVINASEFTVVDLNGRVVLRNANAASVNELGRGLYIINGKKVIKK